MVKGLLQSPIVSLSTGPRQRLSPSGGLGGGGAAAAGLGFRGGRHLCDGWNIPGAHRPSALHGVTGLRSFAGAGKGVTVSGDPSQLEPPPHQTFLCGLEPRVSRFPG